MPAETLLIADDEPTVRSYIRSILVGQGFRVVEAIDGVDALEQVERQHSRIDLLLTDIRMPRMDGIALARSLLEIYPEMPVIFISGYPMDLDAGAPNAKRGCASLAKPFTRQALLGTIQKCLSPPGSAVQGSG